jgi:phage terminase small subunit
VTKPKATKKRPKNGTNKVTMDDRRRLFVEAYMSNSGNLRQSALAAGYGPGGADKAGNRLSKDVLVLSMLDKRKTEILAPIKLTTERTLQEAARLAFSDIGQIIGPTGKILLPHELDPETRAAIASFEIDEYGRIKYKFWDKNAALEKLFKNQNLYKDDNKGRGGPAVQVAIINLVPLQPAAGAVIDAGS